MNYQEFLEQAGRDLGQMLAKKYEGISVQIVDTEKLQGESYRGLQIGRPGSMVRPVINPETIFEDIREGRTYDSALNELARSAESALEAAARVPVPDISNYEEMKTHLTVQLVSREANADMLEKVPHRNLMDMAEVYRISLGNDSMGEMSTLVTNQMLAGIGISSEQLHRDAMQYAPVNRPFEIRSMNAIMNALAGMEGIDPPEVPQEDGPVQMYVATSNDGVNGAGVIAYPEFMEAARQKLGGDFYILPSSIHEVILVPVSESVNRHALLEMVTEINATVVRPEEKLTDNVYRYYIKEKTAPAGYLLDPVVRGVIITTDHVAGNPAKVVSTEPTETYVYLKKESANPAVTAGNSNYSLAGAVYGIYSDAACTKQVTTLTSKADGNSDPVKIAAGTYYAKEKTAPKNFKLNTTVTTVTVTASNGSGSPAVVKAVDEPIPTEPPEILTSAAFSDGTKYLDASKTKSATIRDTVSYKGLNPNTAYTVTGTIYDAVTQQATGLTSSASFTTGNADSGKLTSSGTVTVSFSIPDVEQYENHTLVVTEILKQGTTEIARHFDLNDKGQTVYILNSGKKAVSQVSNNIEETHTWTITNIIPDGIAGNEASAKYIVKDIIDSRLDYAGNLQVSAKTANGTAVSLAAGTDYSISQPSVGRAGGSWTVTMTTAGLVKLGGAPWGTTTVTFDTKINATAQAAVEIPNSSMLEFDNLSFMTNEVYVYTGDVELRKVDAATGNPLQGAVFGLYLDSGCNTAYLRDGAPYTVISGSDGFAKFHGLKDGTYYIRENKTVKGHELLKDPFMVTVEEGKCTAESITVSNQTKIVLQTGGTGTTSIYLTAAMLVFLALMWGLIILMKMQRHEYQRGWFR